LEKGLKQAKVPSMRRKKKKKHPLLVFLPFSLPDFQGAEHTVPSDSLSQSAQCWRNIRPNVIQSRRGKAQKEDSKEQGKGQV
jgi:hypothetical protein